MEIIVNFLYTNDAAVIQSQTYSDNFIYNMISICDQYFITRLRTVFEYILIDKMTIKRCGETLELACMYNCDTLRKVSLDFIVQNSARILEMHALDTIDLIVLKQIKEHYCKTFNCELMEQRYDAPSDDVVESFVDDFIIDLTYKYTKKMKTITEKSPKIPQTKRQYEKEAIGSFRNNLVAEDLLLQNSSAGSGHKNKLEISANNYVQEAEKISQEFLTKSKQWTKVSTDKTTKKSSVLAALKVNEILKNENNDFRDKFVELKISNKNEPELVSVSPKKTDDHLINRPIISLANFTPQLNRRRISQKQRKLSQNSSIEEQSMNNSATPTTPIPIPTSSSTPKKSPWGNNESAESHSFADIIKSPDSLENNFPQNTSNSNPSMVKPLETIESPFSLKYSQKKKSIIGSSSLPSTSAASSINNGSSFMKIQKDEKKERAYYEKLKTKSFILTQIEETAIKELNIFYNADNVFDERIKIDRMTHEMQSNMNFAVWHQQQQLQQQKNRQQK